MQNQLPKQSIILADIKLRIVIVLKGAGNNQSGTTDRYFSIQYFL